MNSGRVCYVQCNFCNAKSAVNVPGSNMLNVVTVRCGHCANLMSVNMGGLLHSVYTQDFQKQQSIGEAAIKDSSSSSTLNSFASLQPQHEVQPKMPPIRQRRFRG